MICVSGWVPAEVPSVFQSCTFRPSLAAKKIVPLLEKAKKDGRSSDWYPSWKQMLRAILEAKEIPVEPLARKTLHRLVEDKDAALDGYIHNRFETANA